MRKFLVCVLVVLLEAASTRAQDTIITWKKKYIPARIISLNRSTVQYIHWNDTTGEIIRRSLSELRKIKYSNGETVNLNTWQRQAALGLTYFTVPATSHNVENNYTCGISSNGMLLSYYYRGHIGGIVLSAGYAYTKLNTESDEHTMFGIPPYSQYYIHTSSFNSNNFIALVTPRINIGIGNFVPFFDLTLGLEFYSKTDSTIYFDEIPYILEPGIGLQITILKKWLIELKAGIGTRNDFHLDKPFFVPDIKFSFYRILYSHITRVQD